MPEAPIGKPRIRNEAIECERDGIRGNFHILISIFI